MSQSHLALAIAASFFLYHAGLVIYRLYFHPLAKFPGPKLAAASRWWECYQDLFTGQGGEYILQVEEMHNKYGEWISKLVCRKHPVLHKYSRPRRSRDP